MPESRRSYQQYCGLAAALDKVGERWTLLVVRELLLGPKRYTDLHERLPGLTTNLLARRLKQMEKDGLVAKEQIPPPTPAAVYRLTPAGQDLEPLVLEASRWGLRYLSPPGGDERVDIGWSLLNLKRRYRGDYQLVVEIRCRSRRYELRLLPDRLLIRETESPDAELVLTGSFRDLHELFFGPTSASEVVARGGLVVEGKFGRWPRLLAAFGLS